MCVVCGVILHLMGAQCITAAPHVWSHLALLHSQLQEYGPTHQTVIWIPLRTIT